MSSRTEPSTDKKRAPRNRTLVLSDDDREELSRCLQGHADPRSIQSQRVFCDDFRKGIQIVEANSVDLLFLDPPYNLEKTFNGRRFSRKSESEYTDWLLEVLEDLVPKLKPTATIYLCGDWQTSVSIFQAASSVFKVRNRITWERDKGRGARSNWKNNSEDIWFCTMSNEYTFNADDVRQRRRVIAPYRDQTGQPKDWHASSDGNFRDTHPSNLWTDISIPFWSMPENTDHPTQKSEKLLAKLILASSNPGDLVLDPFMGSGTTLVTCKKLDRRAIGFEIDRDYCLLALKRLHLANTQPTIQGYEDNIFWNRNTLAQQKRKPR